VRVLIIADDVSFRATLAAGLTGQPGVTAVDQTQLESDLASTAAPYGPDVIVWDLGDSPDDAARQWAAISELETPVIVLGDDEVRIAEAVASGAKGALSRNPDPALLLAAVQAVGQGLVVIDPVFPPAVVPARGDVPDIATEELTHREVEVLQLLVEGLPNKRIAQRLGISEHTVKFHVDAILGKLGAHSRTEAVTRAARLGLIIL
jgi:DNA-binding NarL/FixJ family response regulator